MKVNNMILLGMAVMLSGSVLYGAPQTTELPEPKAIKVVEPSVPYDFRKHAIPGEVAVSFVLDMTGRPADIEVESASHREYAESVVKAIRRWRFETTSPHSLRYVLPVVFKATN